MSHQNTQRNRVDIVLETFRRVGVTNAVGDQPMNSEFLFQTVETAFDSVLGPTIPSTVAKHWAGTVIVKSQLMPEDFERSICQKNYPLPFIGLIQRNGQDNHTFFKIYMSGFYCPCFRGAASRLPHEFKQVTEYVITYVVKNFLELLRRIENLSAGSRRFIFDIRNRCPVDMALFNSPVESPLDNRNRVVLRIRTPSRMQVHPLARCAWVSVGGCE